MIAAEHTAEEQKPLRVWRCRKCGRILHRAFLAAGSVVEVKCGSCNQVNLKEVERDS